MKKVLRAVKYSLQAAVSLVAVVIILGIVGLPVIIAVQKHELLYLLLYAIWLYPAILLCVAVASIWAGVIDLFDDLIGF